MNKSKIIPRLVWIILLITISLLLNLILKKIGTKSSELNGNLNAIENKQSSLIKLQKDFSSVQEYENQIKELLPDKNNVINLIKYIEDIATKYSDEFILHIDKQAENKNKNQAEKKADVIIITVDGKSSLSKFMSLASTLESGPYLINISDFELESDNDLLSNAMFKIKINVNVDENF